MSRAKTLKPRRMWTPSADRERLIDGTDPSLSVTRWNRDDIPVLVIPLTPETVDALILKTIKAQWERFGAGLPWTSISQPEYRSLMNGAKADLAAIGIKAPRVKKPR